MRSGGLTYGWNLHNIANARDPDSSNSPDELHDGFIYLHKPNTTLFYWQIAVPNGTYSVHLLAGDPNNSDPGSVYVINVQGVQALSGTPTSTTRWFEKTVTVTVSNGLLTVSNGSGEQYNKINAIDITQVSAAAPPRGRDPARGLLGSSELTVNDSSLGGSAFQLTNGGSGEAGSTFYTSPLGGSGSNPGPVGDPMGILKTVVNGFARYENQHRGFTVDINYDGTLPSIRIADFGRGEAGADL